MHKTSKRQSGGFLLGSSFGKINGHSNIINRDLTARDGNIGRLVDSRDGVTPSPRSSRSIKSRGKAPVGLAGDPFAKEVAVARPEDGLAQSSSGGIGYPSHASHHGSATSRSPGPSRVSSDIDPSQLINMALALSEGRRRAASGIHRTPERLDSRRIVSHGNQRIAVPPGSPLSNDVVRKRLSARQSLHLPAAHVPTDSSLPSNGGDAIINRESSLDYSEVEFDFSISTLQRAEKARTYFELSHHYRRLLQGLPPLKSDRTAPGNVLVQTHSEPGIPGPQITRIQSDNGARHDLGREYNPLQYLRNERLRRKMGQQLQPSPDLFDDIVKVRAYVQQIESRSLQRPSRSPSLVDGFDRIFPSTSVSNPGSHRRDGTVSSAMLWFDSPWSFTPMVLFADTIWTESRDHKWSIENRRGQKIFPDLQPPQHSVAEEEQDVKEASKQARSNGREPQGEKQDLPHEQRGRHKRKFLSIHKVDDDDRRRLPWRRTRSASSSRASSRSSESAFGTFGGVSADGINIAPLVRHMQKQMQQGDFGSPGLVSPEIWDGLPPESGTSPKIPRDTEPSRTDIFVNKRSLKPAPLDLHKSRSFTEGLTKSTIIAGDGNMASDLLTPHTGDLRIQSATAEFMHVPDSSGTYQSSSLSPGNVNVGTQQLQRSETDYLDFANVKGEAEQPTVMPEEPSAELSRRSFDSTRSFKLRRHGTSGSVTSARKIATDSDGERSGRAHGKSMSKLLKGGRLAELMRGETSRKPEKDHSKDGPRSPRSALPVPEDDHTQSDSEDEKKLLRRHTDKSVSTLSSDKPRYHIALPSFRFPNGLDNGRSLVESPDPITQQQTARREQSRDARHTRMGPPRIEVPNDDVKPKSKVGRGDENLGLRGLLSPIKRLRSGTGPSRPGSIRPALSNQGSTIDLPVVPITQDPDLERPRVGRRERQWSIANQLDRSKQAATQSTTVHDVERLKALFLSSGVKACELCRRGETAPRHVPDYLSTAQQKTGAEIDGVVEKDAYRSAGRLWSNAIVSLHQQSETELERFRKHDIPQLRDRIDKLRLLVGEELTNKVQVTADNADAFTIDLTTHQTLAVKSVHDAIDSLLRKRRKKWRLIRRVGFAMLEWLLLAVMWLAWFIYVLFKIVRGALVGVFKVVRWLSFLLVEYAGNRVNVTAHSRWPRPASFARLASSSTVGLLDVLEQRGLVKHVAGDRQQLRHRIDQGKISAYSGIDPTASSLHLGHLLPLNILFWLYSYGHTAVSLVGDATVRIGDPTDRLQARNELKHDQRLRNIQSIEDQLHQLWGNLENVLEERDRSSSPTPSISKRNRRIDSNNRWLSNLTVPEYLATVGQCGKLGAMLSRDTVKNRLEKGESMSLAEFNYPMIQAYDWWYMFQETGVEIQIGGSDQYGNIVAGMDLIDWMVKQAPASTEIKGNAPFGITTPLLASSTGEKFGKSAGNAVWLDPTLTKPFDLYGYLVRTADADVERYLKLLTLVPNDQISTVLREHAVNPARRKAQHLLALEICRLAHGADWAAKTAAEHEQSRKLILGSILDASADNRVYLPRSLVDASSLSQILVYAGLAASNSKASALRQSGGLYIARLLSDETHELEFKQAERQTKEQIRIADMILRERYLILRSGKWKMITIEVLEDKEFEQRGLSLASGNSSSS
ncbi:tyrosine-tRNA ligase [Sphaceloma murrayae]|uniref:Tyrosine--tRNA ligase n=1 Tax=Sphaceloma murrayae TaxID=2082308 RepID=A0A2K1R3B9_9PEZI|nr:tyrosine-tRNA ligase [Sphaceloma murrayae]